MKKIWKLFTQSAKNAIFTEIFDLDKNVSFLFFATRGQISASCGRNRKQKSKISSIQTRTRWDKIHKKNVTSKACTLFSSSILPWKCTKKFQKFAIVWRSHMKLAPSIFFSSHHGPWVNAASILPWKHTKNGVFSRKDWGSIHPWAMMRGKKNWRCVARQTITTHFDSNPLGQWTRSR